ncbi:HNH endonuclease [Thermoanaerobacter thermohydrosulfuricus WC1]|uniref:HNH endonuclease n=1 Tax=Thermoanaerobacter thermohydrosulfuricus WC1 TaxID=1198630 RepID=M8CLN2_THETY|nr:HNH endonuclease [Thermoanaerobacter thermohydrosulfuricus]EMT38135.1 HNH endonuclease [Thermoanaerobacter thermohydrosulfuricus WC1]
MGELYKKCTRCGEVKPLNCFGKDKSSKDGYTRWCKECRKEYYRATAEQNKRRAREWYYANLERAKESRRRWRQANREKDLANKKAWYYANREKVLERNRQWRESNKERKKERDKKYYLVNKDRIRELQRKYREENKDKVRVYLERWKVENSEQYKEAYKTWRKEHKELVRAYQRNYKARKKQASGTHTGEDIKKLYAEQDGKCFYCGKELEGEFHVDHKVPLSRGGSNSPDNLVLACPSCNLQKNDKTIEEYFIWIEKRKESVV